ncbi:Caspase-9 [Sciurus carolinensis]|uniref:Caspase-9 n=1 Tax=Sciurus carolinensis TaxID=30640 RepID=A0AA41SVH9_SCICA|nr:Caspase-9 [Sciurus carolinensis]
MDEADRQLLRRSRVRLVGELQVAPLWDALLNRELFTPDMIEDIQRAGSGSRRDQARQLITDLESRGRQALPLFISCLEDTGQDTLASFLRTSRQAVKRDPEAIRSLDLVPEELHAMKLDPAKPAPGNLTPVVLGPKELQPAALSPETPRPVDIGSGGFSEAWEGAGLRPRMLPSCPLQVRGVGFTGTVQECFRGWVSFCGRVWENLGSRKQGRWQHLAAPSPSWCSGQVEGKRRFGSPGDPAQLGNGCWPALCGSLTWTWRIERVCLTPVKSGPTYLDAYVLSAEPCGHCLIINNVSFSPASGLGARSGSNVDCEKMQHRFRSLHFNVEVKCDLTAKAMVQALVQLARRDHRALDCCAVVILSHGCQASHYQFPGAVYGTDGRSVSVERIVSIFNGTGCPSLGGKPKLFFIQACGGEQKDHGFMVAHASGDRVSGSNPEPDAVPFREGPRTSDQLDAVSSLPTPSDILVSYSTFPGFVSWRDTSSGSWYIETLDGVLERWAHSEDLQSLLLRVANSVSERGIYKQIPGCFNFLRKKLFFKT